MRMVERIYIDGAFVTPQGREMFDLFDPARGEVIGQVRLADGEDAQLAIQAAKRALPVYARTGKAERLELLHSLHEAVLSRADDLEEATILEYGAPVARARWTAHYAAESFLNAAKTLQAYRFNRPTGGSEVVMEPVGAAGLITPWNANAGFICNKLAYALAAGCTAVIKPSEMSALQTEIVTEALHAAGAAPGLFNIVTGRGEVVGAEITTSSDIAKISFTGSTAVGKSILKAAADTVKRVTLELGGKSPSLILEDADLEAAVPMAITAGFQNSGQACVAGTRILVPQARLSDVLRFAKAAMAATKVGDLRDPATAIGPMVSARQYERVQRYIRLGIEAGATLIAGGTGPPDGLGGYFVRPTLFADVTNEMTIAREEIFGPVLCILTYRDEDEAVAIANDTNYGLASYVFSSDPRHARAIAARLQSGRVVINGAEHDPLAPFGGYKQSGIGREYGVFGLEAFLESKAILGVGVVPTDG
jgi:aldehyde dehydrogenase (NAD+)